jgi:hypothetical protein
MLRYDVAEPDEETIAVILAGSMPHKNCDVV